MNETLPFGPPLRVTSSFALPSPPESDIAPFTASVTSSPRTGAPSTTFCALSAPISTETGSSGSEKGLASGLGALLAAATSGRPKFFLGTDSAPHAALLKEASVCGAGCFTAPAALELYAEAFETAGALERLEGFASHFGADFYGLPRNSGTLTLRRQPRTLPEQLPFGEASVKPLCAGWVLNWSLQPAADAVARAPT